MGIWGVDRKQNVKCRSKLSIKNKKNVNSRLRREIVYGKYTNQKSRDER